MQINKSLKWLVYICIFAVPFVPFVMPSSMYFPFISGKNMMFRFIVEIMFASWAILALRDVKFRSKWSWLSITITVFTLIVALADIFGENPIKSIWSNFERMEGFVAIAHMWMYFMVLGAMMKTEGVWYGLFNTSIGAAVMMSFYGLTQITQHADSGYRVDATLGNSTYLAVYLLIHIFLCLILWWRAVERSGGLSKIFTVVPTYIYSPIVVLFFYVFYRTGTRGALLGLMGGIFITAILVAIFEKKDALLKNIAIGGVVIVLALGGTFLACRNTSFVQGNPLLSRLAKVTTIQGMSTEGRFMIWPMAWQGFKDRPILGWGQEGFNFVFNKYYDPKMYGQEAWFDRTHNVVLDWLIAAGALGFLSYLSIFGIALWLPWRKRKVQVPVKNFKKNDTVGIEEATYEQGFTLGERALLTGMFAAYFFHNLFVFDNLVSYILFFTILAYIHTQEFTKPNVWIHNFINKINLEDGVRDRLIAPMIVTVFILVVYFVNWQPLQTNLTLIQAMMANNQSKVEESYVLYQKSLSYGKLGQPEVREQLMSFASSVVKSSLSQDKKIEIINFIIAQFNQQLAETPTDARYFIFAGAMMDSVGAYADAEKYLLKAVELSPRKQTIRMELVNNYLNTSRFDDAVKVAKETYELETGYRDMVIVYATTLLYDKKIEEAESVMNKYKSEVEDKCTGSCPASVFVDDRVLNGYVASGAVEKVLGYFEDKIKTDPKDLQSRYRLVQLYVSSGQKQKAIVEVNKMIEIEPGFKTQGEGLLKELQK